MIKGGSELMKNQNLRELRERNKEKEYERDVEE